MIFFNSIVGDRVFRNLLINYPNILLSYKKESYSTSKALYDYKPSNFEYDFQTQGLWSKSFFNQDNLNKDKLITIYNKTKFNILSISNI